MIYCIHQNPKNQHSTTIGWCFIVFIVITIYIFYSLILVCFGGFLGKNTWQLGVLIIIFIADLTIGFFKYQEMYKQKKLYMYESYETKKHNQVSYLNENINIIGSYPTKLFHKQQIISKLNFNKYKFPIWIGVNLIIIIFLLIQLIGQILIIEWSSYFGLISLLKFYEIILFNQIISKLLHTYYIRYKLYLIIKIFYMMVLVSHILGCIFYVLDLTLIQEETFGPFNLNPLNYYMGQLVCFSSIYLLTDTWRYVYALYYAVSLVATVAYGDIIPKNHIEDLMVIFYLFFSTITISWIIQQMVIMFRRDKTSLYTLLADLVAIKLFLNSKDINHKITTNYLLNKFTTSNTDWIVRNRLNKNLYESLFVQSSFNGLVPSFFLKYVFKNLRPYMHPENYVLLDNNPSHFNTHHMILILIKGNVKVGYSQQMFAQQDTRDIIFGFDQFLVGTQSIHKYFRVITTKDSNTYAIQDSKLKYFIQQQIIGWPNGYSQQVVDYTNTKNVNSYQLEKFRILPQKQNYQIIQQMYQLKNQALFVKQQTNICNMCYNQGHTAIECQKCHYVPDAPHILEKMQQQRTSRYFRYPYKMKKVRKKKLLLQRQNYLSKYINQMYSKVKTFESQIQGFQNSSFENYFNWHIFQPQYSEFVVNNSKQTLRHSYLRNTLPNVRMSYLRNNYSQVPKNKSLKNN